MNSCPKKLQAIIKFCFFSVLLFGGCTSKNSTGGTSAGMSSVLIETEVISYTAGSISAQSAIQLRFASDQVEAAEVNQNIDSPFRFEPELSGVTRWVSSDVLEFRPDEALPADTKFRYHLDSEIQGFEDLKDFSAQFWRIVQDFELRLDGMGEVDTEENLMTYRGRILVADEAAPVEIEKMLVAKNDSSELSVRWEHSAESRKHSFEIGPIRRTDDNSTLKIAIKGEFIGVSRNVEESVVVPGLSTFLVVGARPIGGQSGHIEVLFSNNLKARQPWSKWVTLNPSLPHRYSVDGHRLRIYPKNARFDASVRLKVDAKVKSKNGKSLGEGFSQTLIFARPKPDLRFVGDGVIVPARDGAEVVIETRSLRALQVEAIRVPQQNLAQFLQVNELHGDREMQRVGQVAWRGRVELSRKGLDDEGWNRGGIDMSPLLKEDPFGLYHLRLSYLPSDTEYTCGARELEEADQKVRSFREREFRKRWNMASEDQSNWDSAENGGWNYNAYNQRKNPCSPAYYFSAYDRKPFVTRNVLVTNIGLSAKRAPDGSFVAIATDMLSAKPIAGANIEVLDYQQLKLFSGATDAAGMVNTTLVGQEAFLVSAKHQGQLGVLKLPANQSLKMTHFDVSGVAVRKGLKGQFYGERGVWRPGDTIFLTFVLEDKRGDLPTEHPVVLEVFDPRGQRILREARRSGSNGFYAFEIETQADGPTGAYRATIEVGGTRFSKTLSVESIVPNRLKIGLEMPEDKVLRRGEALSTTLKSSWLHGAPAKNLEADISVTLSPKRTKFAKFSDYHFDSPVRSFRGSPEEIFSGYLDDNGESPIDLVLDGGDRAPGLLNATFVTRVFEPSGASSSDRFSSTYASHERFVGLKLPKGDAARGMLLTDVKHKAEIVAVGPDGASVATKVDVALYKISWRWWWEKGEENLAEYFGNRSLSAISKGSVSLKGGKGSFEFEVKYPSWGRYLMVVSDQNGEHQTGKVFYMDWPGWAGRAQGENPGGANVLTVTTDNTRYEVGKAVTVTFPTPKSGRALVSVESGSTIHSAAWVEPSKEDTTQYVFNSIEAMAPGAYVNVTVIQAHDSKTDVPMRLYGVSAFEVYDPKTKLEPEINTADEFEPKSQQMVKVSERKGRPMTYTLAVVDEGLLGLTRFRTPDLWKHFYAREALGVRTWDNFDSVVGAYGGKLETLFSIGGDEEGETDESGEKGNRFPPLVRFYGPFALDAGKTGEHRVDIPSYVGAVRVMVVAGQDGAYGRAQKEVLVRKPLMVLSGFPRTLSSQAEVELPVTIFALDEKIKKVKVKIEASGPITFNGDTQKSIEFLSMGDQTITFPLRVGDGPGRARFKLSATGGREKFEETVNIDIVHPTSPVSKIFTSVLEAGESYDETFEAFGIEGSNTLTLELASMPPLHLASRLESLMGYPHGCAEQTTSKAFPQVYLSKLVDLSAEQEETTRKNVSAALEKLKGFQGSDGGIGYWQGGQGSTWTSSWVGHFVLEAKRAGFVIDEPFLKAWLKFQQQHSRQYASGNGRMQLDQAYRLYTLALYGQPDLAAMNRLKDENTLTGLARYRLAAAYALSGQKSAAQKLVENTLGRVDAERELGGTFGSALRDEALAAEALSWLDDPKDLATRVRFLSDALGSDNYLSTHDIGFALVALSRFATGKKNPETSATLRLNGKSKTLKSSLPLWRRTVEKAVGATQMSVKNTGASLLFVSVVQRGRPKLSLEPAYSRNLQLKSRLEFRTKLGGLEKLSPDSVEQGQDLVWVVKVKNPGKRHLKNLALSHIVPAGWEIRNERLFSGSALPGVDYQDIRDDRVLSYFDLKRGETKEIVLRAHATFVGRYYMPPIHVEAMYDERIGAQSVGQWSEVQKPGQGS